MPTARELYEPRLRRCEVCGEPIGGEPHWVTDYPRVVHERCRTWVGEPWPYERELRGVRRLLRELQGLVAETVAAGRRLRSQRELWAAAVERRQGRPGRSHRLATELVAEGRATIDRLHARLGRVRVDVRKRS